MDETPPATPLWTVVPTEPLSVAGLFEAARDGRVLVANVTAPTAPFPMFRAALVEDFIPEQTEGRRMTHDTGYWLPIALALLGSIFVLAGTIAASLIVNNPSELGFAGALFAIGVSIEVAATILAVRSLLWMFSDAE